MSSRLLKHNTASSLQAFLLCAQDYPTRREAAVRICGGYHAKNYCDHTQGVWVRPALHCLCALLFQLESED